MVCVYNTERESVRECNAKVCSLPRISGFSTWPIQFESFLTKSNALEKSIRQFYEVLVIRGLESLLISI